MKSYMFRKLTKGSRAVASLVILSMFVMWSFPVEACGCGVLIMGDAEKGWEYGTDTTENAFISYEDGIENLLINLDIQARDTGAVLVVPITSEAQYVEADILSKTPEFTGFDVEERAVEHIKDIRSSLLLTQGYPIVWWFVTNLITNSTGVTNLDMIANTAEFDGVDVFQHIEKEGMIAEVLSAKTSDALYNYLNSKGLQVDKDSIPIFQDYINNNFSFVAAWIDPSKEYVTARGLTMRFPTDEIYYPLKPNSAYSGKGKDKSVTVLGYVSPDIYEEISGATEVTYRYSETPLDFAGFNTGGEGFGFTNIFISADPQQMVEDIYMSDKAPLRILNAHILSLHPLLYALVLLVIISVVSTYVSLRITKMQSKSGKKPKIYFFASLNCLTIIGTLISLRNLQSEHRFRYVLTFSIMFLLATLVVTETVLVLY